MSVAISIPPRAAYLAIGTELTSGQVTNRNAAWISAQLERAGIPVSWHLCVPDDRPLMADAISLAAGRSEILFITGGLGPTSDDFTRDVVGEWWHGLPARASAPIAPAMEWHEPSWSKIVERLSRRGIVPPESNRQQCWYPRGARVLANREGTADGFMLEREGLTVFVLPGPPREIEAIWSDHVVPWITQNHGGLKPIAPLRWQVLGKSEAELGDLVEDAVRGSGLLTGYRASPPYVEVKIWIPHAIPADSPAVVEALERLEQAIGPWTVTRGDEDLVERFLQQWGDLPLRLVDLCTEGRLSERIWKSLRGKEAGRRGPEGLVIESRRPAVLSRLDEESLPRLDSPLTVWVGSVSEGKFTVMVDQAGVRRCMELTCPFPASLSERQKLYVVERLLACGPSDLCP